MARPGSRQPRPDDPDADAPDWWRRSRSLRRVPLIAAVILIVIILRASSGSAPPALAKSCTTPSFALSAYRTKSHQTLQWAATGPPGMHFQLTVGVARLDPGPNGTLKTVPEGGRTTREVQAASRQVTMGSGCRANSTFGVIVAPGTYTVRMFTLSGPTTSPVATSVAQKTLTVTAR